MERPPRPIGIRGVGMGTGIGCGRKTFSAIDAPTDAARDTPATTSSVRPTYVITACTLKSADSPEVAICKRSLSPIHIARSTTLATMVRCISERPALDAASEKDVGTIRTELAARTAPLFTLIRARENAVAGFKILVRRQRPGLFK